MSPFSSYYCYWTCWFRRKISWIRLRERSWWPHKIDRDRKRHSIRKINAGLTQFDFQHPLMTAKKCKKNRKKNRVLLGFTGFYWVLPSFNQVLPYLTGFYWVLPSFSQVLSSFTGFYWVFRVFLGFMGFDWVWLGFTKF